MSATETKSTVGRMDLAPLRVLVIDDNHYMRQIIKTILKGVGIGKVLEARDGAEALGVLKQVNIDLVVADYHMAPLDGVDFTRLVRASPDSRDPFVPIIMVTGYTEKSRVASARDAGVTEVVAKPLTARALLQRLESVIVRPRRYIKARGFIGPDRRRGRRAAYAGDMRRSTDATPVAANKSESQGLAS